MDETVFDSCATALELMMTMKARSNHGRTSALRVKVFSIEVKKNAGAGLGQERYEYLTEIHREYNAEKQQPQINSESRESEVELSWLYRIRLHSR
jgi:hypothetical protein